MNNCSFTGRLTASPELKITPNGKKVCSFTLAVDRRFKGADDKPNYIDFVAWEHNAEFLCKWFDKGVRVAVTGELQTRLYEDKETKKKTKVCEVLANSVEFADGKREANANFDNSAFDADGFMPVSDDDLPFN
jgi:single-strand DNA-binding protein